MNEKDTIIYYDIFLKAMNSNSVKESIYLYIFKILRLKY